MTANPQNALLIHNPNAGNGGKARRPLLDQARKILAGGGIEAELVETRGPGLKTLKGLHIDCGDIDQYNLVYGARRMHRELDRLGVAHMYEEFPDNHSSVDYRMDISLPFLAKALSA